VTLDEALAEIGDTLGSTDEVLLDGLPGGRDSQWGYDEQLILEIGEVCRRWKKRQREGDDHGS